MAEIREFKKDINKRIDDIDKRMDRIETRIRSSERHNKILTSALVSAFVTTVFWLLIHWKGQ